jgi:hypothetical protein
MAHKKLAELERRLKPQLGIEGWLECQQHLVPSMKQRFERTKGQIRELVNGVIVENRHRLQVGEEPYVIDKEDILAGMQDWPQAWQDEIRAILDEADPSNLTK